MRSTGRRKTVGSSRWRSAWLAMRESYARAVFQSLSWWYAHAMGAGAEDRKTLHRLREEMAAAGREREAGALDALLGPAGDGEELFLKLRKRWYTPAEVAERVGVSRQTVVKWIERGELDAELTPAGHHLIPASAFTTRRSVDRADQRLVPARP